MEDDDHFKIWICFAIILVGFGVLWGGVAYCTAGLDSAAKFGDSFGAINSIFSSLAAAGAVYAVILQRKELRESRKAAEDSAKAQADLVKLQASITIYSDWSKERDLLREKVKELRLRQMTLESQLENPILMMRHRDEIDAELTWLLMEISEQEENLEGNFQKLMESRKRVYEYLGDGNNS